jgi:hypothetical protein
VVSLTHVAGGVQLVTHDAVPSWQAWGLAVGLDINSSPRRWQGSLRATQLVCDKLHRLTRWGIPAVMGFSMALNALEFTRGVTNTYELAAGVAMGVILPALSFSPSASPPSWPTCDPPPCMP